MCMSLHWLDVLESVKYKVIILTSRSFVGTAPRYLAADCVPVSEMAQRRHLCSTAGHQLVVSSYRLNSCGLWTLHVHDPRLWNTPPRVLRDTSHNTTSFGHSLKTFFLSEYQCIESIRALAIKRNTNLCFTYLLQQCKLRVDWSAGQYQGCREYSSTRVLLEQ